MSHEVFINTSSGRRSIIIGDDFCNSLSVSVADNGESVRLFVATWLALLADSPLTAKFKPWRLYVGFIKSIQREGIKSIVLRFSDLAHQIVQSHYLMGTSSSTGEWVDGMKDTPVFFEYCRYFKTGDVDVLRFIYTFLNFGKKLEYEDEAFHETAFRSWIDVEKRLTELRLQDDDVSALRAVIHAVLPSFKWTDLRPKFGPGSVQERGVRGRIGKIRNLAYDGLIDRFLLNGHIGMYGYGEDQGVSVEKIIPDPSTWHPASGVSSRVARLRFVPKNLKVSRSICMEPNTLMFFQQAVLRQILELLHASPLSAFIDIENQQRNRDLALYGSYTSEVDTLDLSAASDSVSLELIKRVFPASWLIPMLSTRSYGCYTPDGTIVPLKKFAPMGSALCFPTQCIVFASVCILAACKSTYDAIPSTVDFIGWLTPSNVLGVVRSFAHSPKHVGKIFQPLAVYGDDICVDRRLTDEVKSILDRLGFVVNNDKSFCGSQNFRESCGGYYLNGYDVTPLYYRVKGVKRGTPSPSHVASQVHLINECGERQLHAARRFLHNSIMNWGVLHYKSEVRNAKNPIPYVSNSLLFGIVAKTPANSHLLKRYNDDYQREEVRGWTISCEYYVDPGPLLDRVDKYEYMRWWASRSLGDPSDVFKASASRSDTGGTGLRWRWMPSE